MLLAASLKQVGDGAGRQPQRSMPSAAGRPSFPSLLTVELAQTAVFLRLLAPKQRCQPPFAAQPAPGLPSKVPHTGHTRPRSAAMAAKALLAALCAALLLQQAQAFIRVYGTSFADEQCREFTFVGANT